MQKIDDIKAYPLVYLSVPFRNGDGADISDEGVRDNIAIAAVVAKNLWENEIGVLCPHLNTAMEFNWDKIKNPDIFLDVDLKMQMICDAVIMLPNWEKSIGANKEKEFAESIGQPVYFSMLSDCGHLLFSVKEDNTEGFMSIDSFRSFLNSSVNLYPKQFFMKRILQAMSYFLHLKKNRDYSPQNILATGEVGIATRLWDKTARYLNLVGFDISKGKYVGAKNPQNESIEDTLMDLANYAIIALIHRHGFWGR